MPEPGSKDRCQNCFFMMAQTPPAVKLRCCKNAPSAAANVVKFDVVWPLVNPDDWCGEHRRQAG